MGVYLVSGAAGFIAFRVTQLLLENGHEIIGIDNLNDAYDVRLKQWRLKQLVAHPGFRFYSVDISERDALEATWERAGRPAAVIHLAARAGVRQSVENPWIYFDTNVTGTLNLLQLCQRYDVGKLVLASTSSLYGASNEVPYREDSDTNRPLSPYAASKKTAEVICATYHALYGIDITVCRYFTVYGPAGRPDMSPFRFVQWISEGKPMTIYGDGQQSRDFTYIDDIARGTIAALRPLGYETINLGANKPVVINDTIRLIERLVGRRSVVEYRPRHPADVPATWADITRARELLGWQPNTTYEQGMTDLVRWYQDNREWAKDIQT